MADEKLLVSKRQAAGLLSISVRTLDYLIASGEIGHRRIGRRVLIPHQILLRFVQKDHTVRRLGPMKRTTESDDVNLT